MRNVILLFILIFSTINLAFSKKITDDQLILGKPNSAEDIEIKSIDGNNILKVNKGASSWQFSNDAGVNFLDIGSGGGGGDGGINLLSNPSAENGLTDWEANGGTLSEVTTATEVLAGEKSFSYLASAQNDYVESATVSLNEGLYGNACEGRVFYVGSDENNSIQIVDGEGNILAEKETPEHDVANFESVFFRCPTKEVVTSTSELGDLHLRLTQTGTVSKEIVFDRNHLGSTIGLVTIVDTEVEEKILSADVTSSTDVSDLQFNNLVIGKYYEIGGLATINGPTGDGVLNAYSEASESGEHYGTLAVNASSIEGFGVSLKFKAKTETLYIYYDNGSGGGALEGNNTKKGRTTYLQLRKVVERQVYKNIPRVADNVNSFSASTSNSTGTISEESPTDWIDGDCSLAGFNYTCDFVAGTFSEAPICFATGARNAVTNQDMIIQSVSSTQVVVSGSVNGAFNLNCKKNTGDFKTPTVQPVLVNQVTSNNGDPLKICRISQTSATTTAVFESADDCFDSGSRVNAGDYTTNIKNGYFKSGTILNCQCQGVNTANGDPQCSFNNQLKEGELKENETFNIAIRNASGSDIDKGFQILCIGEN